MVKIGKFYIDKETNQVYLVSKVSHTKDLLIGIGSANRYSEDNIKSESDIPKCFTRFYGEINIQVYQNNTIIKIVEDNLEEIIEEKLSMGITRDEIRKLLKEYRKDEYSNV